MNSAALDALARKRKSEKAQTATPKQLLLLGTFLVAVTYACVALTHGSGSIVALWPANGVLLAVLLRTDQSAKNESLVFWTGGIAIALANLAHGNGLALSVGLAGANVLEVGIAYWLLCRFLGGKPDVLHLRSLALFALLAGVIAPLISATFGTLVLVTHADAAWFSVWVTWFAANALGMITVTPFALVASADQLRVMREKRCCGEAAGILALILLIGALATQHRALLFVAAPVVLLATFRFGFLGAATTTLLVALIAIAAIAFEIGAPLLEGSSIIKRILVLQALLVAAALWSLPVAALLAERDDLILELKTAKAGVEAESSKKGEIVRDLRRRLWAAEENERLHLARELHDQTGQNLVAATLALAELEKAVGNNGYAALQRVYAQLEHIRQTLRRIAWELRPPSIEDFGLEKALKGHVKDWGNRCGIETDFRCTDAMINHFPEDIRTTIFRFVQEGLTNVMKHAVGASKVQVTIERAANILHVSIEDNGCGFELEPVLKKNLVCMTGGLGLAGMRERVSLVGGEFSVDSKVGGGTKLCCRIRLET